MRSASSEHLLNDGGKLSPQTQSRGFRLMVVSAVFAVIGSQIFAANVLTLIAWNLGAEERYIGLLGFLANGAVVFQLFIVGAAQRRRKKPMFMLLLTLSYLATIPIFFARWVSDHAGESLRQTFQFLSDWSPHQVGIMAALTLLACCVTARQLCMYWAFPSWMGLLREVTPPERRGRLLGQMRTSWQSSIMITLILTGLYLGQKPSWERLQVVMIFGFLAQALRLVVLIPVPSPRRRQLAQTMPWWKMVAIPVRDRRYRPFLLYVVSFGLAIGLSERFRIVYLLRLGFGQDKALIAASLISLGAVVTLMFWGRLADRFGNRGIFGMTVVALIVCSLLWLLVDYSRFGLVLAMGLFAANGAFLFGNSIVQTRYIFASLRPELDAAYIAVTSWCTHLAIAIGSLAGGQILDVSKSLGLRVGETAFHNYHLLFLLAAAAYLIPAHFRNRFKDPAEAPTRVVFSAITQPIRIVAGALLFWPRNDTNQDDPNNRP